jgi:phosphatidylserine/phosphatidylglycerophosphate/cardiolipin synthase-like enzyme
MKQTSTPIHTNIEKFVLKEIDGARKSIYISMAWFTAKKIQQALLEKKVRQPN